MNTAIQEIVERIHGQVIDLDTTVHRLLRSWAVVKENTEEQAVYLDSVALNLHSFYSGLERLFELIARTVDQVIPEGESWRREILSQMASDLPQVRPAVVGLENAKRLDEFRRFRHLVRNVYASELIPERMTTMLTDLPDLWNSLRTELLAFAEFLEQAA
ncbi:MAG: antitoxin [Chloroflexi bacterium]|nr:antitoxin [Chloroflexota bacterium]